MLRATVCASAVCCGAWVAAPVSAEVPDELSSAPIAELFGLAPTIGQPKLSPNGTELIFLQQNALGIAVLQNLNLADGSVSTLLAGSEGGHDIVWCDFASETRILCDLRRGIPGRDPEYQRYFALDSDGSDLLEMRRGTGCVARDPLRDTYPIDWLPDDPEHILFVCGGNVSRLNLFTRRVTAVIGAGEVGSLQRLVSDGHGNADIYRGRLNNNDRWFIRDDADSQWVEFHVTNPLEFEAPLRPVGFGTDLSKLYHIAWDENTNGWGLFAKDLTGTFEDELVFSHPELDIELVNTLGAYERVVSVVYFDGLPRHHVIDERVAEVHEFVTGLLPNVEIEILDESWDGNVYLARARSGPRVGEYILVNMTNEGIQAVGPEYAQLAPYALLPTNLVRFRGVDGGAISAHLTLPADTVGPVPAVIIPREEPTHDKVADPDFLVQYLATMGYAVLRVENRGPAAQDGGWLTGRAAAGWNESADDISAAATFLSIEGISEPNTICGAGKNYGAYSAFMAAIKYPELLQCIVSIAGIADPRFTDAAAMVAGASVLNNELLNAASPVMRAADLAPPVLLFHGTNDPELRMANHAVSFANALSSAGKQVQFIEYPDARHDIDQGPYRIDMLTRIGEFLAEHIGTAEFAEGDESQ